MVTKEIRDWVQGLVLVGRLGVLRAGIALGTALYPVGLVQGAYFWMAGGWLLREMREQPMAWERYFEDEAAGKGLYALREIGRQLQERSDELEKVRKGVR